MRELEGNVGAVVLITEKGHLFVNNGQWVLHLVAGLWDYSANLQSSKILFVNVILR